MTARELAMQDILDEIGAVPSNEENYDVRLCHIFKGIKNQPKFIE